MRCYRELKHRFRGSRDMFIACDMLVFYKCGNDEVALAPDAFVSFGVPPGPRARYSVRRGGKPPDVVLEFASPSTVEADVGKKNKYRRMGVQEYWLVDPVGGYHDPRVQGFQLLDRAYERMPWEKGSGGLVAVWSPLVRLEVRFADGQRWFWDRKTAQYLELPEAEDEARLASKERARQEAEARVESTAQALKAEQRARKVLEARIAEFEAIAKCPRKHT